MGKEESTETAGQILTAARRTFARVGIHGARMQEIANEAENKFKNQPPDIMGFTWESFGCPIIQSIAPDKKTVVVRCDNRH